MTRDIYYTCGVPVEEALRLLKELKLSGTHHYDTIYNSWEGPHKIFYIHDGINRPQGANSLDYIKTLYPNSVLHPLVESDKVLIDVF